MLDGVAREVDERALVDALKHLRALIEQEHALEVERAASVAPLAFEASGLSAPDARRSYVFRTRAEPARGASAWSLKVGDTVDIVQSTSTRQSAEASASSSRGSGVFGTLAAMSPGSAVVEFGRAVAPADVPTAGVLRLRVDDNQRTIRLRAIERVVRERHALHWIGGVLTADFASPAETEPNWEPPSDAPLTAGQRRAVVGAARSRDVFLIQGPPGTGKTTVIAALVRYFVEQRGARVLLSSKGHRAIDNALDRIGTTDLHMLRLGQSDKVTGAGQAVLLTDKLAEAISDIPQRHLAIHTSLEELLRSLEAAEHLLAPLDSLSRDLVRVETELTQRLDEIETTYASGMHAIREQGLRVEAVPEPVGRVRRLVERFRRAPALAGTGQDRRTLYRDAESWVAERRRAQLDRPDLLELRDQLADLQATRRQQLARAAQLLPQVEHGVAGVEVPPLTVSTPDETQASLLAVRSAAARARAAVSVGETWGAWLARPGAVADLLVETADVVAATAIGVNSGRDGGLVAELEFDVAIIDEAGQAQLTDLVVPLSRARTVILVGDHQQLPPFVDDELLQRCMTQGLDTAWLTTSLFEQLWDQVPPTHRSRLDVQFRMPQAIADFLGRAFYAGQLGSASSKEGGQAVCDLFRAPVVLIDTSGDPERGETAVSPGFVNRCEARLVAEIVARLPRRFLEGEGLGVIAPYSAQVAGVRQALGAALGLTGRDAWLVDNVATVDSFQGQERDVVLVSLTRSNASGAVGFLSDLKRLNVTLSRARAQLVIIGDLSTLCAPGGAPARQALAGFVGDLAAHLRQHGEVVDLADFERRLSPEGASGT